MEVGGRWEGGVHCGKKKKRRKKNGGIKKGRRKSNEIENIDGIKRYSVHFPIH